MNHFIEVNGENIGNLVTGSCISIEINPGYINLKDYYGLGGYDKLKQKGKFINLSVDVDPGEHLYFKINEAILKYEQEIGKEDKYKVERIIKIE